MLMYCQTRNVESFFEREGLRTFLYPGEYE